MTATELPAAAYRELVTEAQMETAVRDIVRLRNARLFHVRRSDVAPELADLLDWLIVDPAGQRVLLIEAKSQKRIITAGQHELLAMLRECHRFESGIVRPTPRDGELAFDDFLSWLGGNER